MSEVENVSESTNASTTEAAKSIPQWYDSRSVQQLADRLAAYLRENPTIDGITDAQKSAVSEVCLAAAPHEDQTEKLALSLAFLHAAVKDTEWLDGLCKQLADSFSVWENLEKCAEVTDKMPGKQVADWLKVILASKGADYLAELVFKLPFRLWGHVERIFLENGKKELMLERVIQQFHFNSITPDLMFWLWKNKDKDNESIANLRKKYLTDANQIFKVLRQDAKGNYLKAQRDLRKLLLDSSEFQKVLMDNGERGPVLELIRCTKRLPLLDANERQSLLVKIYNLYPDYKEEIEERGKGPRRVNIGRITSKRGYNKRVAELKHLIEVEIPENSKAIEVARAHGDLSENSEFKFAKEQQRFLGQRRREWEESLNGLRAIDFTETHIDKIILPGCVFTLQYADGTTQDYTILGLLDGEVEKNIISFDTPLAKLVIGHEVGVTITLPDSRKATITAVKPLSPEMLKYVADEQ